MVELDVAQMKEVRINPLLWVKPISPPVTKSEPPEPQTNSLVGAADAQEESEPSKPSDLTPAFHRPYKIPKLASSIGTKKSPPVVIKKELNNSKTPIKTEEPPPVLETPLIRRSARRLVVSKYSSGRKRLVKKEKFLNIKWIPKRSIDCFRDLVLSEVDIQNYHSTTQDEFAKKVIELAKHSQKSQVDRFVYESKSFVVMSWLTAARIFEYDESNDYYVEVKRIPGRYIPLSPKLITSVHVNDSKFYLAYLWGGSEDNADSRPYIEIRDIYGKLLDKPHYYNHIVKSIYSDKDFIYVKTAADSVYIHRKDPLQFRRFNYCIDFTTFTNNHLIGTWVVSPTFHSFTRLPLITATSKEILVTCFDPLTHRIAQCFKFKDDFNVVSIDKIENLIIIHRNRPDDLSSEPEHPSKVDLGIINASDPEDPFFMHSFSLSFEYYILQVKIHNDNLYLYGHPKDPCWSDRFEVGCLHMPTLRPLWTIGLTDVDSSSQVLIHEDNVALIKNCQRLISIKTAAAENTECSQCKLNLVTAENLQHHNQSEHRNIFSGFAMLQNKHLLGTNALKPQEEDVKMESMGDTEYW